MNAQTLNPQSDLASTSRLAALTPCAPTMAATGVGELAAELLETPGFSGKVLAAHSQAVYVIGPDDQVLWLADLSIPDHRRCVQVTRAIQAVDPGANFEVVGDKLVLGHRCVVSLNSASRLRLSAPEPGKTLPFRTVERNARWLRRTLGQLDGSKGLSRLLRHLPSQIRDAASYRQSADRQPAEDPFLHEAQEPIRRIAAGCEHRNVDQIAAASTSLIGLGRGLTPSGDDFLGGLLFVASWLSACFPEKFERDVQWTRPLLETARAKTNRISFALLHDMALGHGPHPLHKLVTTLLMDTRTELLWEAIESLREIGHSTGWDILAGVAVGSLMLEDR